MIQTKNFNPTTDPKLLCTCGKSGCDKRSVRQDVLDRLQLVRDDVNRPLQLTSGGRCPLHKDELKRIKPADHQQGIGVDISVCNGFERGQLVELGLKHGFNAIGIAKSFVHLGYREGCTLVIWTY